VPVPIFVKLPLPVKVVAPSVLLVTLWPLVSKMSAGVPGSNPASLSVIAPTPRKKFVCSAVARRIPPLKFSVAVP
jgi:hypothetical protein